MVKIGFVVEGDSEVYLPQSARFREWLSADFKMEVADPVVNAGGNGNLCSHKIGAYVELLRKQAQPDKVVVLSDLDPDQCAPCIAERKALMGAEGIDLIVIARKAIESWFLADTEAMRVWSGNPEFFEEQPESLAGMPWDRLRQIRSVKNHGPGRSKPLFAKKFINNCGFDVRRAAQHPACPSARYFVEKLCHLATGAA